jgi:RND family efflux transporter MFP subunit
MRPIPIQAVLAVALLASPLLGCHRGEDADKEPEVTATVTTAAVRAEALNDLAHATGLIQPSASGALTVASPKAAVVTRVLVGVGQAVRAGQPLVVLANAPASELAFRQASDAESFAEKDLERVKRLYGEHLAAADQLSAAEKTLADAKAAVAAQLAQGTKSALTLSAPAPAVVATVTAAAGDRVAQDASLMVLAREGDLVAKLGVEPADAARIAPGQTVLLKPVFGGQPFSSRLGTVGRQTDAATRAIDAVAPVGAGLPVGSAVQADIVTGSHRGLLVPRAAVVFDETGPHVFTVSGGKAHRVFVQTGADQGQEIEVKGPLAAGALVAVQGAYELQDGMSVRTGGR